MNIASLKNSFNSKRDIVVRRQGQYERLLKEKSLVEHQVKELNSERVKLGDCVSVFQKISEQVTGKTKELFERLITEGLNLAFPNEGWRGLLEYDKRGNSIDLQFLIEKQHGKGKWMKFDPFKANSGGVACIYSFILRLVLLLNNKTQSLKTLILDEQFISVSSGFRAGVLSLLKSLGIQVIMVTHEKDFIEGVENIINVELKDGQSVLSRVEGR